MTETAQTVKEVIDILTPIVKPVADRTGDTVEHIIAVYRKQVLIEAYLQPVKCLLIFLIGIVATRYYLLYNGEEKPEHVGLLLVAMVVGFVGIIIGAGGLLTSIPSLVTAIFNPDYLVLMKIQGMLKGGLQ